MDLRLKGKCAIVTGGTRGIGFAIAESLAEEGANVALCARKERDVNAAVEKLKKFNVKILGNSIDISNTETFQTWINDAANKLGGIDFLILNAGAMVSENTDKDWRANFSVDLMGAVHATTAAKPFLEKSAKQNGDASVVIISSISAIESLGMTSYGPIKAALIHLAKGFSKEVGHLHIRTNVISPGPIYFEDGYWQQYERNNPDDFKKIINKVALKRMGTPQDIANAVLFLASPVSSYISGSNLIVDGGYTTRVDF